MTTPEKIALITDILECDEARLARIVALTRQHDAETDPHERENIIRAIVALVRNEPETWTPVQLGRMGAA
jgi:hypothetical protein